MLEISIDWKQVQKLAQKKPQQIRKVMIQTLRVEVYQLNKDIQLYARGQSWHQAPLTRALRKGRGYGPWFARFSRYYVDPERLTAYAGLISKDDIGTSYLGSTAGAMALDRRASRTRLNPISRGFATSARRLAKGYTVNITRQSQQSIAKALRRKGEMMDSRRKRKLGVGKSVIRKYGGYFTLIPRIGQHKVRARPIVEKVWARNRGLVIRSIERNFARKLAGERI